MKIINVITTIALLFIFIANIKAGEVLKIVPLKGELNFDGVPSEPDWQLSEKIPLKMHFPVYGNQPTEESDVRITYDKDYLWVSAKLYYKDISKMVSNSKKRDETSNSSDYFGIILDSYDDNENALAFFTMPSGLKIDYSVSNDALGNGPDDSGTNYTWNSYWDVMTSKDDSAWYVEMRIPFSSLRFQTVENITKMGLIINRGISYCNEIDTYPAIDTKYGENARMKPSLAETVAFENIASRNPVYIAPYLLTGFTRDWTKNEDGSQYVKNDNPDLTGGLDVKYNINSNLTLDFTANTDFAQVEADDETVNLTRYSLSFPEKRLFFQERASIFNYELGGPQSLFYSRNIGITNGEPVRILGGARMVGRIGKWDVGFLDMNTVRFNENPAENFGVVRLRKQVINENSYIGGIVTSRLGFDGKYNVAYGIDGIFRLFKDDYMDIKIAQTQDKNIESNMASPDPGFFRLAWQRRSEEGFGYEAIYAYWGKDFNPGSGFMFTNNIHELRASTQYGWFPGKDSEIFKYRASLDFEMLRRIQDGNVENMELSPQFEVSTKSGYGAFIAFGMRKEGLLNDFQLTDHVFVPAGTYTFYKLFGMLNSPKTKKVAATLDYMAGGFYDGNMFSIAFKPEFSLSSSFQVSGSYQLDKVSFSNRVQSFTNNIARVKITYMLNTRISLSSFVQYNEIDNIIITNFRLRYNPRDGNDLYLVFNDLRTARNFEPGIKQPPYNNRTVVIKYTHTFRL
ncbi:MAG: carbohydrate binding family 9 domain-containing protein [Mariniphaga sp.]|nr:carbohydrate binding family 9 domain-containing protein [Mariniphaga sp.]